MGNREFVIVICIILMLWCLHKILNNVASIMVLKQLAGRYEKDTATVNRIFENNIRNYVSKIDGVDGTEITVDIEHYRIADYMELDGLTRYISGDAVAKYIRDGHKVKKDIGFRVEEETCSLNDMNLIVRMFD